MANMKSKSLLRKCIYADRGCTTTVTQKTLLSHRRECGFAPVQCSHDECEATVSRKDLANHQENCEFQSVTCEECLEAMKQKDHEEHICVLPKNLARMTKIVQTVQSDQVGAIPDAISFVF